MVQLDIIDGDEILDRMWLRILESGVRKRRVDSTHTGLILSAIASEISVILTLRQTYSGQTLDTMTDKVLIEQTASRYAHRRLASKAKVNLVFYRMEGYTANATIHGGFVVRSATNPNIMFKTISTVTLYKGQQTVSVMAYSIASGSKNNVKENTLTLFGNNSFNGKLGVTNPEPAFGGYDDESISHLKNRAGHFRYQRDKTVRDIQNQLYQAGVKSYQYYLEEYIDGPGTYMVCIDTDSDYGFEDVVSRMKYNETAGISVMYVRASRIYVDMYITIQTAYDTDYEYSKKDEIYRGINDAVQRFFAAYCVVGADVRINALKAALNNALSNYDIANIDIEIANAVDVDGKRKIIDIDTTSRAYPNQILISLDYVG